jgi:hypothetical protein
VGVLDFGVLEYGVDFGMFGEGGAGSGGDGGVGGESSEDCGMIVGELISGCDCSAMVGSSLVSGGMYALLGAGLLVVVLRRCRSVTRF